jgi:hypothetical protein
MSTTENITLKYHGITSKRLTKSWRITRNIDEENRK